VADDAAAQVEQAGPTRPTGPTGPDTGVSVASVPARVAVVWETLQAALAQRSQHSGRTSLDVLDLGGGTGGLAVPLAEAGHRVTVVDPSPDALAALDARAAGRGSVRAVQGDADTLRAVAGPESYDVVVCHGVLERVDDVGASLAAIAEVLRTGGLLSVVVANRYAAVLARTLAGQFADARRLLTDPDGRWGLGDPLPRRFDAAGLLALLEPVGLRPHTVRGARVLADMVPGPLVDAEPGASRSLLTLERELAGHPAFRDVAAAVHVLATKG
jgi:SAM-dependent methyltransferase